MYTTPEVRELGALSSITLGSTANVGGGGLAPYSKGTVNAADLYTASTHMYGTPCTQTVGTPPPPGGFTVPCG